MGRGGEMVDTRALRARGATHASSSLALGTYGILRKIRGVAQLARVCALGA